MPADADGTWPGATLLDVVASVRTDNEQPFLLDADGTVLLTYGDAARRSAQVAHALRARGLQPGDRVAMQVEKRVDALLMYLACIRSGVALLPMNTGYTAAEVAHLVADAEPGLVLHDADLDDLMRDAAECSVEFTDHPSGPDDLAAILYTSGTTGRPKGAMLSHRNLAANCLTLAELWGFTGDDVLLHALPVFHTHGLFVATNCALIAGAPMVFLTKFEPDAVLRALPRCTVMMGVPTFYTRLLGDPRFDASSCASMRLFISGSAPLLASVHDEFRARVGYAILERYGMTETTMLASNPLDGERRAGTVGMPLPGVEVRVVGDDTLPLPVGEVGGIEVRGPNVFAGYWRRPDLAATEFTADGFFRTGDVGRFDDDGYLHIVGRSKDLIITGGLNVYPVEVEAVLDELPGVLETAVIGVPDADFGEAVVAVVVPQPGASLDPAALRSAAREQLAGFKVPRQVHVVEALPRNAMGKVEKAVLRRTYGTSEGR
jgi:malonyl-CoA/methylmalonyl-CoA synthetase